MWMNYLRLGSIVMLCCLLSGCDTSRTEYVHHGEWVYRNESSYKIEIKGAIVSWAILETATFTLPPAEMHRIDFWSDGDKHITPDAIGFPFMYLPEVECSITIDDAEAIRLVPDEGIRNRNNYQVEKLGTNDFRFTYVFTDENVAGLTL
ncbi:hypothetical protein A3BBH6_05640 [Alistipes onderdonkii subsp. vulgaris]|jgi:hypothetical protein|uniref:hypothetical protein n=1 Tax=Alistipes onderdonkii TaxID=328813 RepID=UPI0011416DC6|nr:hypothetical protein [Alistipes onderdonkii]BBL00328.1 hypothetical protein A3BBH6_05640 [Alistipes onderdonkii subsp. vulgaris]